MFGVALQTRTKPGDFGFKPPNGAIVMYKFRVPLIGTILITLGFCSVAVAAAREYKGHKYRGAVQSIGGNRLVLDLKDAEPVTFIISPKVQVTRDDRPAQIEQVQVEDLATVTAERSGEYLVALSIFVMEPE